MNLTKRVAGKIKRLLQRKKRYKVVDIPLATFGTSYGGWTVPANYFSPGKVCYLAGAGEDISFDVALVDHFGVEAIVIDPTPRALDHFNELVETVKAGRTMMVNHRPEDVYHISPDKLSHLRFIQKGVWSENKEMKFYKPRNDAHVSHSLVNLQKTEDYLVVQVSRLDTLMKELGHEKIHLLKLDIEGAEYEVLYHVLRDRIDIDILCIEFDEMNNPLDSGYRKRIDEVIEKLEAAGYAIVYMDGSLNTTMVKRSVISAITGN